MRSRRLEARGAEVITAFGQGRDQTLFEACPRLAARGIATSKSARSRFLQRHGSTRKKTGHATAQHRPDVLKRRRAWLDAQPDLDPERPVFVDRTGTATHMTRSHGRCPRGCAWGSPTTTTRPPRRSRSCGSAAWSRRWCWTGRPTATGSRPMSAMSARRRPSRKTSSSWTTSSHKRVAARRLSEAAGAELRFFPPDSPDFSPIETAFPKLKAPLRKAAARTVADPGPPSAAPSISSRPTETPPSSPPQATNQNDGETIYRDAHKARVRVRARSYFHGQKFLANKRDTRMRSLDRGCVPAAALVASGFRHRFSITGSSAGGGRDPHRPAFRTSALGGPERFAPRQGTLPRGSALEEKSRCPRLRQCRSDGR